MNRTLFILSALMFPLLLIAQDNGADLEAYRESRLIGLLADPREPVDSANAGGISWFDLDERYILPCRVERLAEHDALDIPTYSGITKPFRPVARLHFQLSGQDLSLTVYRYVQHPALGQANTPLFLPFRDLSNGESTYGGGRYLDLDASLLEQDSFILDLNLAYNPLCAYADGFNCPIPPRENHLPVAVEAGERAFGGTYKHRD